MRRSLTARRAPCALGPCALGLLAASALLVGCAAPQTDTGRNMPPKLHIGTGSVAGDAAAGAAEPMNAGTSTSGRLGLFGGYRLAGPLPDQPTHAAVWRWTGGSADRADLAHLAKLLGLPDTAPQRHAHGWVLTSATGELRVRDGSTRDWSYVRSDLADCPPFGLDVDNRAGGGVGCATGSAVDTAGVPVPAAPGPDDAATRAAARGLLTGLGLTGAEQINTAPGFSTLAISPTVGSLPTQGIETRVDVDARGIRSAMGRIGAPAIGDDYPLRSAKAAFDDLGSGPRPMIAQYCGPMPNAAPTPHPESTPCPSPEPIRVTGAVLGLQARWDDTAGEPNLLVPAWFFSTEGSTYPTSVVAVDPSFIDDAPAVTEPGSVSVGSGSAAPGFNGGAPVPIPTAVPPVGIAPNR